MLAGLSFKPNLALQRLPTVRQGWLAATADLSRYALFLMQIINP